jgi:hypothetical protein
MAATREPDLLSGYRPQLITREGRFFFAIPELGQVASGDTVQAAYDALVGQHGEMLAAARAADILDELPPPAPARGTAARASPVAARSELRGFGLKLLIVLLAVLVVVVPLSLSISNAVTRAAVSLQGSTKPWRKLERELERAARPDKALDPERQAKLLAELRVVVSRIKPFVDELAPLFDGPEPATESGAARQEPDGGDAAQSVPR